MSSSELSPLGKNIGDQARKKTREAYNAKASSDFYGAAGWLVGFLITLFASTPILWYLATNASRETRAQILGIGFAVAEFQ